MPRAADGGALGGHEIDQCNCLSAAIQPLPCPFTVTLGHGASDERCRSSASAEPAPSTDAFAKVVGWKPHQHEGDECNPAYGDADRQHNREE
jgi:hypothetical protein